MMNSTTYALLSASTGVTALVAGRIYGHGRAPQGVQCPYVTHSVVGGHAESYMAEAPTLDEQRVQIDAWSKSADECRALMQAIVAALEDDGYMIGYPTDSFEETTQLYRFTIEFYFWTSR